jgi:hypothetical protein
MKSTYPTSGAEGVMPHGVRRSQLASSSINSGWPTTAQLTLAMAAAVVGVEVPHELDDVMPHHSGLRILELLKHLGQTPHQNECAPSATK